MGLRFFASVNGIYDNGIVPVGLDQSGKIPSINALYGTEVQIGAYGTKAWRRSQLGLDYFGSYRHYNEQSYFDGTDQTLQLAYQNQLTKRVLISLKQDAGTISRSLGPAALPVSNVASIGGPAALLFDNRATYIDSSGDIVYQRSSRLRLRGGGQGYKVHRQSSALIGINGYSARGGLEYRISKVTSLAVGYTYTHFEFPRAFGESDIHGLQIGIDRRLTRRWSLNLMAGGFRAEVQGLQRVGLDPVIAALLGTPSVIQAFYRVTNLPSYSGSVTGTYKHYYVRFSAERSVTPGNGIYLTSQNENYGGSTSYTGIRKASLGLSVNYSKLASIGQVLGNYGQIGGGANASYQVYRWISAFARADYRQSQIDLVGYKRSSNRVTIGITFSPSEIPISWF